MNDPLQRAVALYEKGEYRQSDDLCCKFLVEYPDESRAWHLRGYIALQEKDALRAIEFISRAIELKPSVYLMHVNLGSALSMSKQFKKAIEVLTTAIDLHPAHEEAHMVLGNCLGNLGRNQEAKRAYLAALRLKPEWPEALEAASLNAFQLGDHELALEYALRALAQDQRRPHSHRVAGDIYNRQRRYDLAQTHYEAGLDIDPDDAALNNNLGLLLARTAQYEESVTAYKKAISLNSKDPATRHGLSTALLTLGRIPEGWKYYGARLERPGHYLAARPILAPLVTQRPIGKRVLAWADEGIGEQIMFASLLPEILGDASSLSLECDERLVPLFQRSFSEIDFIPRQIPPHPKFSAPYDGQFCLGDAAPWYRPDFNSFPRHEGYLVASAKLTREIRQFYQSRLRPQPLIGISWRTADHAKVSGEKTLSLEKWKPLFAIPGARFVNLQYGDCGADLLEASKITNVKIISDPRIDPLKDLDSFASQAAAMDLVITTSNATAHMAGSLNIPVWTFVPEGFGAMWHWFLYREDSPWYPSMRLLRQTHQKDWGPIVDRASSMLMDFTHSWHPSETK